jgi:hypothetical protein
MAVNVRGGDRDQLLLMPPSVRDWLPEDHLAFFVLDVVGELDLGDFFGAYREDGWGGAVYDPATMLAVLVYAYCTGAARRGASSGAWSKMWPIGCWARTSARITRRWRGSGAATRARPRRCSVRCWRCV